MVGLRGRLGCPQSDGRGDLDRTHGHVALKESLDPQIVAALDRKGVAVVALPPSKVLKGKLALSGYRLAASGGKPHPPHEFGPLGFGHAAAGGQAMDLQRLRNDVADAHARVQTGVWILENELHVAAHG
jgi:hypothetical protein